MKSVWLTLRKLIRLFSSERKLWVPFLITAFVEVLFLVLIWLAPHPPFSKYLAPPLRYFFGERILHYPWHMWFIYHAMKHTHTIASIIVGAFMSGIACVMVRQAHETGTISLREAMVSKQARYGTLLLLWILSWGLAKGLLEVILRFAPKTVWVFWGVVLLAILIQALLVYLIPAAVFEGAKWWKALRLGIAETLRYPISTLAVVIIPSASIMIFSTIVTPSRVSQWMVRTTPEIALLFAAGRLLVWTVADLLMTVAVAHLWWIHRAKQSSAVLGEAVKLVGDTLEESGQFKEGPAVA